MKKIVRILVLLFCLLSCTSIQTVVTLDVGATLDLTANSSIGLTVEAKRSIKIEEYDVVVNSDGDFPLNGKLVVPEGRGKVPVAILIHGSGLSDFNETIYANTPFKDLAFGLAKHGIATLRYDKRYFRNPEDCDMSKIGAREETLDDVNAAIELVKDDSRFSSVFIIGHSQGGSFAPTIAAENDEVDGIIALAGTLRPIYELIYDQSMAQINSIDLSQFDDNTKVVLNSQINMINRDISIFRTSLENTSDATFLFGVPASYWKSLDKYWGDKFLKDVNVPMLVCQGGKDFQVYPDIDFPLWKEALKDKSDVEFKLYPELNHLFTKAGPDNTVSDYMVKGEVSEEVISDIATFIKKVSTK